mgnify:CR=1 FL=1
MNLDFCLCPDIFLWMTGPEWFINQSAVNDAQICVSCGPGSSQM